MGVLRVAWKVEVDMVETYQKNYSVEQEACRVRAVGRVKQIGNKRLFHFTECVE